MQPVGYRAIKAAVDQNITPPGAQAITTLIPTVETFFHELFHIVHGPLSRPEDNRERYEVAELLRIPFAIASRNPESYTMAAIAYYYTKNSQQDQDNYYVEFSTGYAVQGL